ncbi:hypothetical protein D3C71_1342820 [compost metagenome]
MVFVVHLADPAQAVDGILVVELADQRIARIGGHGHNAAFLQQHGGLLEQTWLRVIGVDFEILGHGNCKGVIAIDQAAGRMRCPSSSHTGVSAPGSRGRVPRSVCDSVGL